MIKDRKSSQRDKYKIVDQIFTVVFAISSNLHFFSSYFEAKKKEIS